MRQGQYKNLLAESNKMKKLMGIQVITEQGETSQHRETINGKKYFTNAIGFCEYYEPQLNAIGLECSVGSQANEATVGVLPGEHGTTTDDQQGGLWSLIGDYVYTRSNDVIDGFDVKPGRSFQASENTGWTGSFQENGEYVEFEIFHGGKDEWHFDTFEEVLTYFEYMMENKFVAGTFGDKDDDYDFDDEDDLLADDPNNSVDVCADAGGTWIDDDTGGYCEFEDDSDWDNDGIANVDDPDYDPNEIVFDDDDSAVGTDIDDAEYEDYEPEPWCKRDIDMDDWIGIQSGDSNLKLNDCGEGVGAAQVMLNQLDMKTDIGEPVKVDNAYGPITQKAVKAAQKAVGAKVDGLFGQETYEKILLAITKGPDAEEVVNIDIDAGTGNVDDVDYTEVDKIEKEVNKEIEKELTKKGLRKAIRAKKKINRKKKGINRKKKKIDKLKNKLASL